jgi:hypothetical protein
MRYCLERMRKISNIFRNSKINIEQINFFSKKYI